MGCTTIVELVGAFRDGKISVLIDVFCIIVVVVVVVVTRQLLGLTLLSHGHLSANAFLPNVISWISFPSSLIKTANNIPHLTFLLSSVDVLPSSSLSKTYL